MQVLVRHRLGLEAVPALCGDILSALDMHWIGEDDHRHAQNASLAVDRRPFGPHFREQGFEVLPASVTDDEERAPTKDSD